MEILLNNKGLCNLTTINVLSFVKEDGTLDREGLLEAQRLSARASYRMTNVILELPKWDAVQNEERLTGVSMTGWQDMVNAVDLDKEEQIELLKDMRQAAHDGANSLADLNGSNRPLLVTSVKPEGCATKDHTRTLDNGIFFLDELNPQIDEKFGFTDIKSEVTFDNNKVTKTYKNDIKDIKRIVFKNGRKLDVTPTHPMSLNGEWVETKDLKVGDVLDYKLGFYTNKKNAILVNSTYEKSTNAVVEKTPLSMSEDLAWLLGAYFANGSFTTKNRIKFHCQYKEVHLKVQRIWKELFNIETNIIKLKDRNSYVQDFASTNIRQWLEDNDLEKKENFDRIPLPIRISSREVILSFITGYADNDGCFHAKSFSIDSRNAAFIRHLQEVGEAVGLSFSFSVNSQRKNSFSQKPMYKAHLSRAFSEKSAIDYINEHSIKAQLKGKIEKGAVRSANPYKIVSIEDIPSQETYDIEVENIHWYYQGGLKSHNTLSQLPTVSSGLHFSHSPYYIRRVRINAHDPLVRVCEDLGYSIKPEINHDPNDPRTKVIEFPIAAPNGKTKYDISAIEQLEIYKMFMKYYVDHNASITVHVRNDEWEEVEQWVWDNWDDVVAISFLSLDDSFYQLMPYESIDEETFNKMNEKIHNKHITPNKIRTYEKFEQTIDIGDESCDTGACPIR